MLTAKPIPDSPGYLITPDGRVFNQNGTEKKLTPNYKGYLTVNLSYEGKQHLKRVHRLVAQTYIPNPDNKPDVNHKDGNKQNNRVDNLEWVTNQENHWHASRERLLHTTPVDMLDLQGNYIRTFHSLKSAELFIGAKCPNGTGICQCLREPHRTYYGYRWRKALNYSRKESQ